MTIYIYIYIYMCVSVDDYIYIYIIQITKSIYYAKVFSLSLLFFSKYFRQNFIFRTNFKSSKMLTIYFVIKFLGGHVRNL